MSNREDTAKLLVVCNMFSLIVQQSTTLIVSGNGVMKLSSGIMFLIFIQS